MSRGLPSAVTTPWRGETPQPVWLVHIATGGTPANLYLASYDGDVVFGGQTWSARPIEIPERSIENHSEAPTIELRIADSDGYFGTLLASGIDFRNQRVRLYCTDASALGSGSALTDALSDTFFVEGLSRAHGWCVLRLRSLLTVFDVEVPLGTVDRATFPGIPHAQGLV